MRKYRRKLELRLCNLSEGGNWQLAGAVSASVTNGEKERCICPLLDAFHTFMNFLYSISSTATTFCGAISFFLTLSTSRTTCFHVMSVLYHRLVGRGCTDLSLWHCNISKTTWAMRCQLPRNSRKRIYHKRRCWTHGGLQRER